MVARLIDVLTDQERNVKARLGAVHVELDTANGLLEQVLEKHEKMLIHINRDREARDALRKELENLGSLVNNTRARTDPKLAEEIYEASKPDRYDVELFQIPSLTRNGMLKLYVKMWWGNTAKILYEGNDYETATRLAQKISDLTGKGTFAHREVDSKKDI